MTSSIQSEPDDLGTALQLLATAKQIQQGVAKLEARVSAGIAAVRAGRQHNWMEYEHCKNALGQLVDNTLVYLSAAYQSEADIIRKNAVAILNVPVDDHSMRSKLAAGLVQRANRLYKKVQTDQKSGGGFLTYLLGSNPFKSEQTMSDKISVVGSYLIGTDVLIGYETSVVGRHGGLRGGWQRRGGDWIGPSGKPVFAPAGDIYPIVDATDEGDFTGEIESVIGEVESLLGSDMGVPGMPIDIPDDSPVGHPVIVGAGPGRHHGGGRGWGGRGWGRGFGYGYPYGPPLDYGYTTTVVKEDNTLADLAIAEAIAKNTELQQKLLEKEGKEDRDRERARESRKEREDRDWERARESKRGGREKSAETKSEEVADIVGKGGHGHGGRGGARGFYRGGWYGGDYPEPFAYVGPYEDVDTALEPTANDALAEVLRQNETVEKQLDAKARMVGGSFEDFDNRTVWYTGKMRGGQ